MDINRYSPSFGLSQKHLIKISDFTNDEIFELLYAVKVMKGKFAAHEETRILQGISVALLFDDTSLRTRSALEIGIRQLGGTCVNLPYSKQDMLAGENIGDILNVISRYGVGAIVTREINQTELETFCAASQIPILEQIKQTIARLLYRRYAICTPFGKNEESSKDLKWLLSAKPQATPHPLSLRE